MSAAQDYPQADAPRNVVLEGDALATLRTLPDECVQMCVTSPPYWGLRSYNTAPQVWGGSPLCAHEWNTERYYREGGNSTSSTLAFSAPGPANAARLKETRWRKDTRCALCGAWRGELGGEPDPDLFVAHLVEVFREVRRVLRSDGVCFLNMGDSYAGSWGNYAPGGIKGTQRERHDGGERWERKAYGDTQWKPPAAALERKGAHASIKNKDLCLVPFRLALALQGHVVLPVAEIALLDAAIARRDWAWLDTWRAAKAFWAEMAAQGWWVRNDLIWSKPAPMPESITDRCSRSHEYLFHLAKSERYFWDADAIREPFADERMGRDGSQLGRVRNRGGRQDGFAKPNGIDPSANGGRNARTVWTIATEPYPAAHFAVFPEALAERCLRAGSSPHACEHCGAPWQRLTTHTTTFEGGSGRTGRSAESMNAAGKWRNGGALGNKNLKRGPTLHSVTVGWEPTCACPYNTGAGHCLVLDPFGGSGTVGVVAQRLERDYLLIELQPKYARMARRRILTAGCAHTTIETPDDGPEQAALFADPTIRTPRTLSAILWDASADATKRPVPDPHLERAIEADYSVHQPLGALGDADQPKKGALPIQQPDN